MKRLITLIAALLMGLCATAQPGLQSGVTWGKYFFTGSMAVGKNSASTVQPTSYAHASAWLEVGKDSTTKGLLLPRVTSTAAVPSPAKGLLVYSYANGGLMTYNGDAWVGASGGVGTDTSSLSARIDARMKYSDTTSLSTRINQRMKYTDTASLSSRIDQRLKYTDTANLLSPYARKMLYYTRTQTDSAIDASVDSVNSVLLAVNALQDYWLELRKQDTTYTVTDSVITFINGTRHAYRLSLSSAGNYNAGTGVGLSGNTFYIDSSMVTTVKRLADSMAAIRSSNAGYQDSMLTNGIRSVTLQSDGSLKIPIGTLYGKGTSSRIDFASNGSYVNIWGGLSRLNISPTGFTYNVGSGALGDNPTLFGFYHQIFGINQDGSAALVDGNNGAGTASLGIGDGLADASSMFDLYPSYNYLTGQKRGSRPFPWGTSAERAAIPSPASHLHFFQASGTNRGLYFYDSTTAGWKKYITELDTAGMHGSGGGGGVTSVDGATGAVNLTSSYVQLNPSAAQTGLLNLLAPNATTPPSVLTSSYTGPTEVWLANGGGNAVEMYAYTNSGVSGVQAGDAVMWSLNPINLGVLNSAAIRITSTSTTVSGGDLIINGHGIKATISAYADDAAAGTAGLTTGQFWQTSSSNTLSLPAGVLMVKQ